MSMYKNLPSCQKKQDNIEKMMWSNINWSLIAKSNNSQYTDFI